MTGHICHSMDLWLDLHEGHGNFIIILGLKKNPKRVNIHGHDVRLHIVPVHAAISTAKVLRLPSSVQQWWSNSTRTAAGQLHQHYWGSVAFHPSLCMLAPLLCSTVLTYLFPFICCWFQLWIGFDGWQEFNNEEDWTIQQGWSWANSLFP